MPYFVYHIAPLAQLRKVAEFPSFREASSHAKALRVSDPPPPGHRIKVMFADNELLAEDLLCQLRDPVPGGDGD